MVCLAYHVLLASTFANEPRWPVVLQTDGEWEEVRERSRRRGDSEGVCPVCLDSLGTREQVLLPCSHTFHRRGLVQHTSHASLAPPSC